MNWLEFFSTLFWPVVVMTALIMFRGPIAKKIRGIEGLHLGKETGITFSKDLEEAKSPSEAEVERVQEQLQKLSAYTTVDSSAETPSPTTRADELLRWLPDYRYINSLSEKRPALLVEESWRIIEAELERLAHNYKVLNTRDHRSFLAIHRRLDSRVSMMFWIVKTGVQIRQMWRAARHVDPDITPEQAREYAKQALQISETLSHFEPRVAADLSARIEALKTEVEQGLRE